jgi:hypothetical protein
MFGLMSNVGLGVGLQLMTVLQAFILVCIQTVEM